MLKVFNQFFHFQFPRFVEGGVWRSGLFVGVRIRGSQVPLQSACRCVPGQPQIAPVGIAHSIEYVSRFG